MKFFGFFEVNGRIHIKKWDGDVVMGKNDKEKEKPKAYVPISDEEYDNMSLDELKLRYPLINS